MKKIIVLLASGFEEIEAISPVDYLRRAGAEVLLLGINKNESCGNASANNVSAAVEKNCNEKIIFGAHKINIECDALLRDFVAENSIEKIAKEFDAVVIPGGMPGAANIGKEKIAIDLIKKMAENQKLICAICAAPIVVLAQTGLLSNKKFTCYPGMEERTNDFIIEGIADSSKTISDLMQNSTLLKDQAFVVDGNLITARGPGAAEQFSIEIVKKLFDEDSANKIKKSSCQR